MNQVVMMGNLTKDVELSYTPDGTPVGKFDLAINKRWTAKDGSKKEKVVFIQVTVFKKQAENCATYLKKGSRALVAGEICQDNWVDKTTGQKRSKLYVVANNVQFLDHKDRSKDETVPADKPPAQGEDEDEPPF